MWESESDQKDAASGRSPTVAFDYSQCLISGSVCHLCFFFWFNHFLTEDPCARSPCINSHVGQKQSFCSLCPATDAPRRRPSPKQHFSLGRGGNVWDNNRIVIFGSRRSPAHPGLISPPRVSGLFPGSECRFISWDTCAVWQVTPNNIQSSESSQ